MDAKASRQEICRNCVVSNLKMYLKNQNGSKTAMRPQRDPEISDQRHVITKTEFDCQNLTRIKPGNPTIVVDVQIESSVF